MTTGRINERVCELCGASLAGRYFNAILCGARCLREKRNSRRRKKKMSRSEWQKKLADQRAYRKFNLKKMRNYNRQYSRKRRMENPGIRAIENLRTRDWRKKNKMFLRRRRQEMRAAYLAMQQILKGENHVYG